MVVDEQVALPNEFGCTLSLRIKPGDGKCQQYRKSASATCRECDAWQALESPPSKEATPMASVCKINGCDKLAQHNKDGMCHAHHTASKRIEAGQSAERPVPKVAKARCAVAGCIKQAQIKGLCKRHHTLAINEAGSTAPPDHHLSYECPHCHIALSTAEAKSFNCPECQRALRESVVTAAFQPPPPAVRVDQLLVFALEEALEAKKADWLAELSAMTPGRQIMSAARMIETIAGMGY